ncbi:MULTISPECIES: ABC transporter substrate-binding protein [unclassified Bradyrhizobium]|uniref:ABC transporter substrate-binding protein n=1 Tax=unclassified Bradyrhizobium TaxID=2631580 RepID=UPI0024790037|nr:MULTISPECIES: ABC transporter substrate-binding protein [unclassified Bradyrhizobium]
MATGKRRACVVVSGTTYGTSMGHEFARAFDGLGGKTLSCHRVEEGETKFEALVEQLPRGIDILFYGGTFEGAPLLRTMRTRGRDVLLATGDGCWDRVNFLEPAGAAAEAGEGVLVLSACPEIGRVQGSREFAARYEQRFGQIGNYAVNAYDAAKLLISAIRTVGRRADRASVGDAIRHTEWRGIAYPEPVRWDEKGDNVSAVTALHVVKNHRFSQVALIPR